MELRQTDEWPLEQQAFPILETLLGASRDAILVKGVDGRYLMASQSSASFLGKKPAEVIGRTDDELFPMQTASSIRAIDREIVASGRAVSRRARAGSGWR